MVCLAEFIERHRSTTMVGRKLASDGSLLDRMAISLAEDEGCMLKPSHGLRLHLADHSGVAYVATSVDIFR